ncbi:hypothetical protein PFISCL1PPCAC_4570, partial [Pristionchus fissidentatus]
LIITNELKIRNSHLEKVILIIEKYHPGLVMQFVVEEVERNLFSLPIRFRLATIITAVFFESKNANEIRYFVARHPALSAECYDPIIKILERRYADTEHEKRREDQRVAVAQLLAKFPSETDFVETDNKFTISNDHVMPENI